MKKLIWFLAVGFALLCMSGASAEIYPDQEKPSDWNERPLFRVTFFPSTQNDCMVIECGGESMLLDGGYAGWRDPLYTALEQRDLTHLTYIFNSHPHDDHIGAITKLLARGTVTADAFMSPFAEDYGGEDHRKAVYYVHQMQIPYHQVMNYETFFLGKEDGQRAEMKVYCWPDAKDPNGKSAGLYVTFGDSTMLFTADWNAYCERWFVETFPYETTHADVLKVPHHGINMLVPEFIDGVDPKLAVFTSTDYDTKEQTKQLTKRGIIARHNGSGTLVLETDGNDWYVSQEWGWH